MSANYLLKSSKLINYMSKKSRDVISSKKTAGTHNVAKGSVSLFAASVEGCSRGSSRGSIRLRQNRLQCRRLQPRQHRLRQKKLGWQPGQNLGLNMKSGQVVR
jgi:hypothetical protein